MIFTAASAFLVAATSVAAAPGLSLKISGPGQVNGADHFSVVATIVNTGDETLKLFNDPRGTLSSFETNSFAITSASGATPKFVGAKVKYTFEAAAKSGAKAFTVLAPGQSIDVTHDLAAAYNFNSTGAGAYTIEPSKLFHYLDASGKVNEIYAHVTEAHTTSLTGSLVSSKVQARTGIQKRASFVGCSSTQQSQINAATPEAVNYATAAYNYLVANPSGTTRFTTWFGTYTTAHHDLVQGHYQKIISNSPNPNGYTYDCSTCTDAGTYAYVYPGTFGKIYLCPVFWQVANTGTDSRAGTIVHESSHFTLNGGTSDYAYGQSAAKSLAKSNSNNAVMNADSHEYFAENNPFLS
jgi:peptidyl-Lys metalloendopeptidase